MELYKYNAYDVDGKKYSGRIKAESESDVRVFLRRSNLSPITISKSLLSIFKIRYIKNKDIVVFSRQLATLINAGIPIEEALNTTANQSNNNSLSLLIFKIREDIIKGQRLNLSLKKYPEYFNKTFISLVSAGDSTGNLGSIFDSLSIYLEDLEKTKKAITSALTYPLVILSFSILAIVVLLVFVMPQIVNQFVKAGAELPLLTTFLLSISSNFYIIFLLLTFVGAISFYFYKKYTNTEENLIYVHKKLLSIPLYGSFILNSQIERFSSTMSLMLKSGLNFDQALDESSQVISNNYLKQIIDDSKKSIREGKDFIFIIEKAKIFPSIFIQLISSGFTSGNLALMFNKVSEYLRDEIINRRTVLISLLEPMIILFMGGIVLLIILAILIPIMQMNTITLS